MTTDVPTLLKVYARQHGWSVYREWGGWIEFARADERLRVKLDARGRVRAAATRYSTRMVNPNGANPSHDHSWNPVWLSNN